MPYSSCIVNTAVVVAWVIFIHGFSRCRGYWIWVFCCCLFSYVYICSADYVGLPVLLYLLQCLVPYHMLSKMRRSSGIYIKGNRWGIGVRPTGGVEDSVQQLYVNQARCNWCVPIVLLQLSIWCNVCACHSPVPWYQGISLHRFCYKKVEGTNWCSVWVSY